MAYTQIRPDIMWDYLDIMMVFPKQSFKKDKEKRTTKHAKLLWFSDDLQQHEHKIPFQNIISNFHTVVPDTKTSFFFV